jgi:hypothetical protein
VHVRHLDMGRVMQSGKNCGLVHESKGAQTFIRGQPVHLNDAAVIDYISDKTLKASRTQISYVAQADAANNILFSLNGNHHDCNPYEVIGSGLPDDVMTAGRTAMQKVVEDYMGLFGSAGKAASF